MISDDEEGKNILLYFQGSGKRNYYQHLPTALNVDKKCAIAGQCNSRSARHSYMSSTLNHKIDDIIINIKNMCLESGVEEMIFNYKILYKKCISIMNWQQAKNLNKNTAFYQH